MEKLIQRRTFLRGTLAATVTLVGASCVRAGAAKHEIAIQNFAFDPTVLNVAVGDTVSWTNMDSASHTASAIDGSWSSETLRRGNIFALTFQAPGQYDYFCKFHPKMKATIIVS